MRGNLPWQANANTPGAGHADQDDGCGLGDGFAAFAVSDKQHGDNTLTLLSNPANASVDHFHLAKAAFACTYEVVRGPRR
jgi:hypothetical protein